MLSERAYYARCRKAKKEYEAAKDRAAASYDKKMKRAWKDYTGGN